MRSRNLMDRLERLELQLGVRQRTSRKPLMPNIRVILGDVRRLPKDYRGERHLEIEKHLPPRSGWERAEFVEVLGPAPSQPEGPWNATHIYVTYVDPDPERS